MKVIKVQNISHRWDDTIGHYITDKNKVGYVIDVVYRIPDGYIKWIPNKIFDRKKYPELFNVFGKYRMPTENEVQLYMNKTFEKKSNFMKKYYCILFLIMIIIVLLIF